MPARIKYNRPELKRHRAALARYERYIPMLKLKQQQLQRALADVDRRRMELEAALKEAESAVARYAVLFRDISGIDLGRLSAPSHTETGTRNIAGVSVPEVVGIYFDRPDYSLFGTPPWVDTAIRDRRRIARLSVEVEAVEAQFRRLNHELRRIIQRVNLFEKVKVPEAHEAIRKIRIHLGDAMAAGVGRARIAKNRIENTGNAP